MDARAAPSVGVKAPPWSGQGPASSSFHRGPPSHEDRRGTAASTLPCAWACPVSGKPATHRPLMWIELQPAPFLPEGSLLSGLPFRLRQSWGPPLCSVSPRRRCASARASAYQPGPLTKSSGEKPLTLVSNCQCLPPAIVTLRRVLLCILDEDKRFVRRADRAIYQQAMR